VVLGEDPFVGWNRHDGVTIKAPGLASQGL
jgi:hypothetical protein